jgi:hypothetical protein
MKERMRACEIPGRGIDSARRQGTIFPVISCNSLERFKYRFRTVQARCACGVFFLAAGHGTECPRPQPDFDLDTAIQALVERLGRNDPQTVKLTGIYHNLIRYWAEV